MGVGGGCRWERRWEIVSLYRYLGNVRKFVFLFVYCGKIRIFVSALEGCLVLYFPLEVPSRGWDIKSTI